MSDTVIQVDRLWKKYRLGVLGTGTLRSPISYLLPPPPVAREDRLRQPLEGYPRNLLPARFGALLPADLPADQLEQGRAVAQQGIPEDRPPVRAWPAQRGRVGSGVVGSWR